MSDAIETPDETIAAPATIETVDLSSFEDETRIPDESGYRSFLTVWSDSVKAAVREAKRYTGAVKAMAEARVNARAFIIRANGFPDWAGDSDAYKRSVIVAENPVLGALDNDAKTRLVNAVKQHVKRNYMLPGVVGYIVTNEPNFGDEADVFASDPSSVLGSPSTALKQRVRDHYKANGLTLPDGPFQYAETNPNPNPGDEDATSPLESLTAALEGLEQVTPRFSIAGILSTMTALSKSLIEGRANEVEGRPRVIAMLRRIAVIATETAAALEGEGEHDEKALSKAYFTTKDTPEA